MDGGPGCHVRRYSSLQNHLAVAPAPIHPTDPKYRKKKYPHVYENKEKLFPLATSTLYEYPSKSYPYHNQNAKGVARTNTGTAVDPEYIRTITNRDKQIQGVIYHPYVPPHPANPTIPVYSPWFNRAETIYRAR